MIDRAQPSVAHRGPETATAGTPGKIATIDRALTGNIKQKGPSMAYLRIYEGAALKEQRELEADRTSIGRKPDNDIVLNAAGVSGHHAVIERNGGTFTLVDNGSTNGVFVNGNRIQRHSLNYWDEIQVFNFTLKFMALPKLPGEQDGAPVKPQATAAQAATMLLDVSAIDRLLATRKQPPTAYVELGEERRILNRVNFLIGKRSDCDARLSGWLAPRVGATIQRRGSDFFILPGRRGRVLANRRPVARATKLEDNTELQVRNLKLTFFNRPLNTD